MAVVRLQTKQRFPEICQFENGIDILFEFSAKNHLAEFGVGDFDLVSQRLLHPIRNPQPAETDVSEDEWTVRDGEGFSSHRAVGDMGSAVSEKFHESQGAIATDCVESEFSAIRANSFAGLFETIGRVLECRVGP